MAHGRLLARPGKSAYYRSAESEAIVTHGLEGSLYTGAIRREVTIGAVSRRTA